MTRAGLLIATALAAAAVGYPGLTPMPTKLIWNATASAPIGLYTVEPADPIEVPELVAVMPPRRFARFMVTRDYIGPGVPLLKHIVGLQGQRVCRLRSTITLDGTVIGKALARDHLGRPLPVWQGCRVIRPGEIFLMNRDVRDSLDSRYFGPVPTRLVIGRAVPLWTDEDGDGRYKWRAPTH